MRTVLLVLSSLFLLAGCATQAPVKIVDAVCDSASCEARLAELHNASRVEQSALQAARAASEDCVRQKAALEKQLQAMKGEQLRTEQGLADRKTELAACRSDQAALQRQAKSDAVACEAMRQELQKHAEAASVSARQLQGMNDLEDRLRKSLQGDIDAKDVEIQRLRSQLLVRVLDRILFETGSAEIRPAGFRVMDSVATALVQGDETIRIEGHADIVPIGPELKKKYFSNWELSTARASSVARFFHDMHGIEPTRMEAVGFSKYRPIAPNDTEANRQRNRRVEIVLTPWKPMPMEGAELAR